MARVRIWWIWSRCASHFAGKHASSKSSQSCPQQSQPGGKEEPQHPDAPQPASACKDSVQSGGQVDEVGFCLQHAALTRISWPRGSRGAAVPLTNVISRRACRQRAERCRSPPRQQPPRRRAQPLILRLRSRSQRQKQSWYEVQGCLHPQELPGSEDPFIPCNILLLSPSPFAHCLFDRMWGVFLASLGLRSPWFPWGFSTLSVPFPTSSPQDG